MTTMLDRALATVSLPNGALKHTFMGVAADADIFVLPEDLPWGYERYHGTISAFWSKDPEVDEQIAGCLLDIPRLHTISTSPGARMVSLTTVTVPEIYEALETVAIQLGVPFKLMSIKHRSHIERCHDLARRLLPALPHKR